jgi:GntR family transcriptional regulator
MNPVSPQSPEPLYLQLAGELRERIRRGELAPGDRLPPERDLVETYGVSRETVRQGLDVLKAEALIGSGPGRGTFVRKSPPVRLPFGRFSRRSEPGMAPWESAAARGGIVSETRLVAIEQQSAAADLADRLGINEGAAVVMRAGQMFANGFLIQVHHAWYALDLVTGSELARPHKIVDGAYSALDRLGLHPQDITDEVSARAPTPEEATQLRLGPGIPVLTVSRTTKDSAGRVLEVLDVVASADANVLLYEDVPLN